jgi:cell division control protein 24
MEEKRNKWRDMVEKQKMKLNESARQSDPRSTGTSNTDFTYFHQNPPPQNPHDQVDDDEEDDDELTRIPSEMSAIGAHSDWSSTMSRNTSQTSLRKMATGGSGPQMSQLPSRAAPPRFPHDDIQGPSILPLTISTNVSNPGTPDERGPKSFFSPTAESPASVWSNSQGSTFPFPRQQIPVPSGWAPDDNKHKTAPPIGAPMIHAMANAYTIDGRTVQRPSLPALQQMPPNQTNRMRSQSSPDIQNPSNPAQKRYPSGQSQSPAETVPVPPIPVHMVPMRAPINRNQSGSPTEIQRRATAQSPKSSRDRLNQPQYTSHYSYDPSTQSHTRSDPRYFSGPSRSNTMSGMGERVMSPPLSSAATNDQPPYPSQLKVKIWFEPQPNYVTIVVPIIIKHRSLIDRIDSKMEKVSSSSIAKGTARLKYQDSDNEMVTMKCDEDVQIAIEEWVNVNEESLRNGVIPDFELYWNEIPQ